MHLLLYGLLAVVIAIALFLLAARFLPAGEQIAPPLRDEVPWSLPERALDPKDVDTVRLPVALRGYRFAETDILLDRLAQELYQRDVLISQLRGVEPPASPLAPLDFSGGRAAAEQYGPAKDAPTTDAPAPVVLAKDVPPKDVPADDVPSNDAPAADEPPQPPPSEQDEAPVTDTPVDDSKYAPPTDD